MWSSPMRNSSLVERFTDRRNPGKRHLEATDKENPADRDSSGNEVNKPVPSGKSDMVPPFIDS